MLRKNKKVEIHNNSTYVYLHKYCSKSRELPDCHDNNKIKINKKNQVFEVVHGWVEELSWEKTCKEREREREREKESVCPLLSIRITLCGKLVIWSNN